MQHDLPSVVPIGLQCCVTCSIAHVLIIRHGSYGRALFAIQLLYRAAQSACLDVEAISVRSLVASIASKAGVLGDVGKAERPIGCNFGCKPCLKTILRSHFPLD